MYDLPGKRFGDRLTLSPAQREWIRRQGRVSRALEAAHRRREGRFARSASAPRRAPRTRV